MHADPPGHGPGTDPGEGAGSATSGADPGPDVPPEATRDGPGRGRPPRRWARLAAAAAVVAMVAGVVVADRRALTQSVRSLGHLDWYWFALGIGFEGLSLSAFGLSRRRLLRADGHQAGFRSVMAITYAGNALSMSIPFAGAQLAAVFSYRQFRRRGLDPAITGWALGVSGIASSSALALVLVAGALAGGAPLATATGFAGAAVFLLPGLTVLLALRYRRARVIANRGLTRLVHVARRLARKPGVDSAVLEDFLDRLASFRLSPQRYAEVFGLAVVNWLADCACLACAIRATGAPVPWRGLILAYGAGAAAGSTGLTPGGFALVEVTLTAALVAAGMNSSGALTAVLAYRLVNFWLILLGGSVTMFVLTRIRAHHVRHYPRPAGASATGDASEGDGNTAGDEARTAARDR